MATRTITKTVTFMHPFRLSAMEHEQSAGSYTVETDEERLETRSLPAYRRLSTFIRLPLRTGRLGSENIIIDPTELEAALARDAVIELEASLVRDAAPEQYGPETVGEYAARNSSRS